MKNTTLFIIAAFLTFNFITLQTFNCFAQNIGINSTGNNPNSSAMLDVESTTKGMLIPRVTQAQRLAMNPLPAVAQGLTVYQTDGTQGFYYNISTTTTPNWTFLVPNSCTGYDNLIIQSTSTSTVTITADRLCVDSLSLSNINVNAVITTSGAGGLDAGTEAANTWYYIFVISNSSGTSVNGLLSLSSTAPTMPAGYTKKRRVGAVRNDGSSNFLQFVQEGSSVLYSENGVFTLVAGVATVWTSVSCANAIPPTSRRGAFRLSTIAKHTVINTNFNTWVRATGTTGNGILTFNLTNKDVLYSWFADVYGEVTVNASQQIDYYIVTVPNVTGGVYLQVTGYYDRF